MCSPGDQIFGLGFGTLAKLLPSCPASALRPSGISADAAAALPTGFVTAKATLAWAKLLCGESILLHAGSGGTGLAVLSAARRLGVEVLATAGSAKKQCLLRLRGVRVASSRDGQACSRDLLLESVSVVVNSLTHEDYIPRSLALLGPAGRFVELSKLKDGTPNYTAQ